MFMRILKQFTFNLLKCLTNIKNEAIIYNIGEIIKTLCQNKVRQKTFI